MTPIRQETTGECRAIHEFIRRAFATARYSEGDEQDYVDRLRLSDAYLPELGLVFEEGGKLKGHILVTRTTIEAGDVNRPVLFLAALSVAEEYRSLGIGAKLVSHALERGRAMGYDAIAVVGDPGYYSRFGFRGTQNSGVVNSAGIDGENVMLLELVDGSMAGVSGMLRIPV